MIGTHDYLHITKGKMRKLRCRERVSDMLRFTQLIGEAQELDCRPCIHNPQVVLISGVHIGEGTPVFGYESTYGTC